MKRPRTFGEVDMYTKFWDDDLGSIWDKGHIRQIPGQLAVLPTGEMQPKPTGMRRSRWGVRRSRVVTFAAIRLWGPEFKSRPEQKFKTAFLLHSHPSGGEGVSPVQGEAIRRRYIKPDYVSYPRS